MKPAGIIRSGNTAAQRQLGSSALVRNAQWSRPMVASTVARRGFAHVHDHNCSHDHDHTHHHHEPKKQSPFSLGANTRSSKKKVAKEIMPKPTKAIEYCENLVRYVYFRRIDLLGFMSTNQMRSKLE